MVSQEAHVTPCILIDVNQTCIHIQDTYIEIFTYNILHMLHAKEQDAKGQLQQRICSDGAAEIVHMKVLLKLSI